MALIEPHVKAKKLYFDYVHIIRSSGTKDDFSISSDLAKKMVEKHCDDMIEFIDSEMKGWLDWDMKSYYEKIKQEVCGKK